MTTNREEDNTETVKLKLAKTKTHNVIECFGPTLVLERVFGIIRFMVQDGKFLPTTGIMKMFSLLLTTTVAILFVVDFDVPKTLSGTRNKVGIINDCPAIVILLQYLTSAVMTSCFLNAANIRIMTSLADLDSTLNINTNKDVYKKTKRYAILALSVIIIVHLISSTSDFLLETTDDDRIFTDFLNYILNFVQDLEILVFYLMITMLKSRLELINEYLEKIIHKDANQDKITINTLSHRNGRNEKNLGLLGNMPFRNLRDLSKAYDLIGETCRLVNDVYNFQIFMTLISAFVYIVIALWTSLYVFRTQVYTANLISTILWCCSEILTVASMAYVCETLLSTGNDTKVLVNELIMDYDLPTDVRAQAKAFMELIDAWPLRLYVYDMFTVDVTLMLKFISVSTTYLIVIIQISHVEK